VPYQVAVPRGRFGLHYGRRRMHTLLGADF
jgi:hypothetical protein